MSGSLFDEIARQAVQSGGRPDARPADEAELFEAIAQQGRAAAANPQPASPAANAEPAGRGRSFVQGLGDPLYGGAQLMSRTFPSFGQSGLVRRLGDALGMGEPRTPEQIDAMVREREAQYEAGRAAAGRTGFDWWRTGGNVVSGAPMAAVAAPATLPAAVGVGALTGAAQGALQPVTEGKPEDYWGGKVDQAVTGAVGGAIGAGVGNMVGRAISPRISPQVRALDEAGVQMTPGQVLGGTAQRLENRATSLPLVGDAITNAQRRSLESFNRGAANRTLQPLGIRVPDDVPVGREMVAAVDDAIGAAYQSAIGRVQPFRPDGQFVDDLSGVAKRFMTPASRDTFNRAVMDRIVSRFQDGPLDGATYKTIDAELGQIARGYSASTSAAEREIAQGIRGVQSAMRGLMARSNPEVAPDLRAADEAFKRFTRLEAAASAQGATEGVFTPQQFSGAVRAGDRTARHGAYATGDAPMQDLSDAARAVLPNNVPDSGTAGRMLNAAAMAGAASGQLPAAALAAGPAAGLLYSRPGAAGIQSFLTAQRPMPIGLLGDATAASGGSVAVPLGALLLGPPEGGPQQRR